MLTLKIDDLLTAPGIQAAIFTVNETFLGKRFINREYDYNWHHYILLWSKLLEDFPLFWNKICLKWSSPRICGRYWFWYPKSLADCGYLCSYIYLLDCHITEPPIFGNVPEQSKAPLYELQGTFAYGGQLIFPCSDIAIVVGEVEGAAVARKEFSWWQWRQTKSKGNYFFLLLIDTIPSNFHIYPKKNQYIGENSPRKIIPDIFYQGVAKTTRSIDEGFVKKKHIYLRDGYKDRGPSETIHCKSVPS